jgi:hypothetical protein
MGPAIEMLNRVNDLEAVAGLIPPVSQFG